MGWGGETPAIRAIQDESLKAAGLTRKEFDEFRQSAEVTSVKGVNQAEPHVSRSATASSSTVEEIIVATSSDRSNLSKYQDEPLAIASESAPLAAGFDIDTASIVGPSTASLLSVPISRNYGGQSISNSNSGIFGPSGALFAYGYRKAEALSTRNAAYANFRSADFSIDGTGRVALGALQFAGGFTQFALTPVTGSLDLARAAFFGRGTQPDASDRYTSDFTVAVGSLALGGAELNGVRAAEEAAVVKPNYSTIADPPNLTASTKPTPRMVAEMKRLNMEANGGVLRDDVTGEIMVPSVKSQRGVAPPTNEVQVDHIIPVDKGGTRTVTNLELRTRANNRAKWNN